MTSSPQTPASGGINFSVLVQALDGIRQWQAIWILVASGITAIITSIVLDATHSMLAMLLGVILSIIIFAVGFNASGVRFMTLAKGDPLPSLSDALIMGVWAALRQLGLILSIGLAVLLLSAVEALIFLVCRVPYLGVALFSFAYPFLLLINLVLTIGLYVAFALLAPATWDGQSIGITFSHILSIVRSKPLQALVMLFLLPIIATIVIALIGGFVFGTDAMTSSIAIAVLAHQLVGGLLSPLSSLMALSGDGYNSMGGGFVGDALSQASTSGGESGYYFGLAIGQAVLISLVSLIPVAVIMRGWCLIYLSAMSTLDPAIIAATEAKIRQRIAKMKIAPPKSGPSAAAVSGAFCPKCGSPVSCDDVFCGNCGQKLK